MRPIVRAVLAIAVCACLFPAAAAADPASSEPLAVQHGLIFTVVR